MWYWEENSDDTRCSEKNFWNYQFWILIFSPAGVSQAPHCKKKERGKYNIITNKDAQLFLPTSSMSRLFAILCSIPSLDHFSLSWRNCNPYTVYLSISMIDFKKMHLRNHIVMKLPALYKVEFPTWQIRCFANKVICVKYACLLMVRLAQ